MIWLATSTAATLVVALALSRARHDARALSWRALLSPDARAGLAQLEERCRLEDAMLIAEFGAAARMRVDRRVQAERLLRAVMLFVEQAQPERLARLEALRTLAKMSAAVMAVPTLSPWQFRLPELWASASLAAVGHAILVSPAERLLLRLGVLSLGFRLSLRSMRRAAAKPQWGRFERGLADWCALDRAHVEAAFRTTSAVRTTPADATR